MTAQEDMRALVEAHQHPDHFCPICGKRMGVCKHTKKRKEHQ